MLRWLCLLSGLVSLSLGHDGVLWKVGSASSAVSDHDLVSLVRSASPSQPLLLFLTPSLSLGDFSRAVGAYAPDAPVSIPALKSSIIGAAEYGAVDFESGPSTALEGAGDSLLRYAVPEDALGLPSASVVLVEADDLAGLDALAADLLPAMAGRDFKAVLTGESERRRVKREEGDESDAASATPAPGGGSADPGLAYGNIAGFTPPGTWVTPGCSGASLAFIGNATVTDGKTGKATAPLTFVSGSWSQCNIQTFKAHTLQTKPSTAVLQATWSGGLKLMFGFTATKDGWWFLQSLNATYGSTNAQMSFANLQTLYLSSVVGNSYACGQTEPSWFTDGKKTRLFAVSLGNFQVEPFASLRPIEIATHAPAAAFSNYVDDCVPFFSPGVWMGVVAGAILGLTLLFGLAMVVSLKTMDRFDDPKGKPLHINVRE